MEQGFFVGFDNDMEDFSNLIGQGKVAQSYKDLKTATGSKNIIGVGIKSALDPKKTLSKTRDVASSRASKQQNPTDKEKPSSSNNSDNSSTTADATSSAEMGASMGDNKIFDGDDADLKEGKMKALKIVGIAVGALVVIGVIIYFVRK